MSLFLLQHLFDLVEAHPTPLNQARDHAHIPHDRRSNIIRIRADLRLLRIDIILGAHQVASAIQDALSAAALLVTVVRRTAPRGFALSMCLTAAKGTAQVCAITVGEIGEEENPAMPATLQVAPQVGLASQNRSLSLIVFQNKIANLALAIPVRSKLKISFDLYCKKPSVSLMMLMVVSMSSFYSIGALVSSGRTGAVLFRLAMTLPRTKCICISQGAHQVAQFT